MDRDLTVDALREVGELVRLAGVNERVTAVVCGAIAAMVVADLPASRVTRDCDVVVFEPLAGWQAVEGAARQVATRRSLPANWLNRESAKFAHLLPLGWRKRCQPVGRFGPLEVLAISRRDLMAMKLVGAVQRPQDLEDILAIKPTADEIAFLHEHLDRLDAESLDRETRDDERSILNQLRPTDDHAGP